MSKSGTVALQIFLAAVLPLMTTFLVAFPLSWLIPDRMVNYVTIGPSFFVPLASGLFWGHFFTKRATWDTRVAYFGWLPQALILGLAIRGWRAQAVDNEWSSVWNNFFGSRCSSSECLNEFLTASMFGSIACAVGCAIASRNARAKARPA